VLNADAVATAECFPIGVTIATVYVGVPVLVAIVYVGATMVPIVFACSLDTVTKAAALDVPLILRWRGLP
jgi:hypothetical protein